MSENIEEILDDICWKLKNKYVRKRERNPVYITMITVIKKDNESTVNSDDDYSFYDCNNNDEDKDMIMIMAMMVKIKIKILILISSSKLIA